jgi:ribosomal protein L29
MQPIDEAYETFVTRMLEEQEVLGEEEAWKTVNLLLDRALEMGEVGILEVSEIRKGHTASEVFAMLQSRRELHAALLKQKLTFDLVSLNSGSDQVLLLCRVDAQGEPGAWVMAENEPHLQYIPQSSLREKDSLPQPPGDLREKQLRDLQASVVRLRREIFQARAESLSSRAPNRLYREVYARIAAVPI